MNRFWRLATALVIFGMVLSACGSSVPSVVGSYKVTIVTTAVSVQAQFFPGGKREFSLDITADGHFVMESRYRPRVTWRGTWRESDNRLTLTTTNKIEFVAVQKGTDLRQGRLSRFGRPTQSGYTQSWSAVRTG
ncbi:MAG TPA: hypothetical protein VID75_04905 [Acidimicrobiales bacterium]|jgi:hypothetical protein